MDMIDRLIEKAIFGAILGVLIGGLSALYGIIKGYRQKNTGITEQRPTVGGFSRSIRIGISLCVMWAIGVSIYYEIADRYDSEEMQKMIILPPIYCFIGNFLYRWIRKASR